MNSPHDCGRRESGASLSVSRGLAYFIAILITFTVVDFFSVKDSGHEDSFDSFNRHFANSYPQCILHGIGDLFDFNCLFRWTAAKDRESKGPKVSAVVWTDAMLKQLSETWPLDMEFHAGVLHTILQHRPKAILVDILFLDDPGERGDGSLEELVDVICDHKEAPEAGTGTKLYLFKSAEVPLAGELTEGLKGECDLDIEKDGQNAMAVEATLSNSPSRIYPGDGSAVKVFLGTQDEADRDFHNRDFRLFWAGHASPVSERFFTCRKRDFPNGIIGVLQEVAEPLWDKFTRPAGSSSHVRTRPCPYTPMLPASILYCLPPIPLDSIPREGLRRCGLGLKDDSDRLVRSLEDKYVVYGAEFAGVGDVYDSPIYDGRGTPGALVHAMALDNLLEMGGRVHATDLSKGDLAAWFYYLLSASMTTALFFFMEWMMYEVWHRIQARGGETKRLAVRIGWLCLELVYWSFLVVVVGGVLLFLTWVMYLVSHLHAAFRFEALNWIAILLVSGILSVWAKAPFAEELAGILHPGVRRLAGFWNGRIRRFAVVHEGRGGQTDHLQEEGRSK